MVDASALLPHSGRGRRGRRRAGGGWRNHRGSRGKYGCRGPRAGGGSGRSRGRSAVDNPDGRLEGLQPASSNLDVAGITGVHAVVSVYAGVEAGVLIDDSDGRGAGGLARGPGGDCGVERNDAVVAVVAVCGVHGEDLSPLPIVSMLFLHFDLSFGTHQDLHVGVAVPHLIHQLAECRRDHGRADIAPHIVRAQVDDDNVGLCVVQPSDQLVRICNVGREESAVTLVLAVKERVAAGLSVQRTDKVLVGVSIGNQRAVEIGAPAALDDVNWNSQCIIRGYVRESQ